VVQVAEELLLRDVGEGESPSGEMVWRDIATVPVPPRTHRKRIIAKALNDAGITPDPNGTPPKVRVLDEDSAFIHEPDAVQPPPQWVI
jgi:hypothetical protein